MRLLHMLRNLRPRLARPKTFLGIIPIQMGTEIISATLFFNKLTGAYGLLAILTGFSLSFIQLSAYLYNVAILVLLAICIPHIRRETPLPNLALAWAYTIDTLINAAYTATFAIRWYLASSSAAAAAEATSTATTVVAAPNATVSVAAATASAAASAAASVASQASMLILRDDSQGTTTTPSNSATVAQTSPSAEPTAVGGGWMGAHETAASLTLIILVTVVRFYFCFIVIAHTRQALQRYGDHVAEASAAADGALNDEEEDNSGGDEGKYSNGGEGKSDREGSGSSHNNNDIDDEEAGLKSGSRSARGRRHRRRARQAAYPPPRPRPTFASVPNSTDPFAVGSPAGEGWKGKLGRALVGVGRSFWLSRQKDDEWTRDMSSRFRSSAV